MAKRANATITGIDRLRVLMVARPQAFADVILTTVKAVGARQAATPTT